MDELVVRQDSGKSSKLSKMSGGSVWTVAGNVNNKKTLPECFTNEKTKE